MFRRTIARAQNLAENASGGDLGEDMLRASLVLAIAALDHFIKRRFKHLVRQQLRLPPSNRKRKTLIKWIEANIDAKRAVACITDPDPAAKLAAFVDAAFSFETFQDVDRIEKNLEIVGIKGLTNRVAQKMGTHTDTLKGDLRRCAKRRNSIVHNADIDPGNPQKTEAIEEEFVRRSIDLVLRFGTQIDGETQ